MLSPTEPCQDLAALARTVEEAVTRHTSGRVRQLCVESADGRLIVHGAALSYYVKQLAIQAVLETADVQAGVPVVMDIQVIAA